MRFIALISDDGDPGEIHGKIRVIGARGVLISNLALRLGSPEDAGVTVEEGAAAHILGADISTDGGCGVWARDGSYVKLENNRISGHDGEDEAGVCISSGSTGRGAGNVISGNASDLQIFQHGVFVGSGETVGDEASGGLRAFASRSSYLELRDDSVVWGDVQATLLSQVHIRATAVHGSARGFANSVIYVRRGATVDEVGCDSSSECITP